jgi:MFS family permease
MGDRIGRRSVFMPAALNVAIATGIMYLTAEQNWLFPGWAFLAFFRFFVGFGNAGMIAVDIPLVQEFVPTYKRDWITGHRATAGRQYSRRVVGVVAGADDLVASVVLGRPRLGGRCGLPAVRRRFRGKSYRTWLLGIGGSAPLAVILRTL